MNGGLAVAAGCGVGSGDAVENHAGVGDVELARLEFDDAILLGNLALLPYPLNARFFVVAAPTYRVFVSESATRTQNHLFRLFSLLRLFRLVLQFK